MLAAACSVCYLQAHHFLPVAFLCIFLDARGMQHFTSTQITLALWAAIFLVNPALLDILPDEVEACSLCAGSTTALICTSINNTTIQLRVPWKLDAMLSYLHILAC